MPRPKKSPTEKQNNIVKLSLSGELHQQLSERAKSVHMPLASYCRKLIEDAKPPSFIPEINYQTFRELGKPLSNLYQLLKLLRFIKTQNNDIPTSIFELLEEELTELRRLRLKAIAAPEITEAAHQLDDVSNPEAPDQAEADQAEAA